MPKDEQPPSFQFYPKDLLSSKAVALMSPEARGGYLMLLAHAWLSPRPGWLKDDDQELQALSGLNGSWEQNRLAIARAFRVRKGWWIQSRMVQERRAQLRRYLRAQKGASITNDKRWGSVAGRPKKDRIAVTPSSSSSSSLESKHTSPSRKRSESEIAGFAGFYQAYPRREDRRDAHKAFVAALKRHRHISAGELVWAAREFAADMSKEGKEERYIKYPAVWLNKGGYLNYLEDEDGEEEASGGGAGGGGEPSEHAGA